MKSWIPGLALGMSLLIVLWAFTLGSFPLACLGVLGAYSAGRTRGSW